MAHRYRTLQQWNQWLRHPYFGRVLLALEAEATKALLNTHYGKHAVLIGVPHQVDLFQSLLLPFHTLASPLIAHTVTSTVVETSLHELPFLSGTVDLVLLPHTLEHVENPRQLLAEACRIIKPEGLILITGFNPFSLFGLMQKFYKNRPLPFPSEFIQSKKIENWLKLADFEIEQRQSLLFRPPFNDVQWFDRLHGLESLLKLFPSLGAVHLTVARAKVIPLTPIRMTWKQPLSGLRLPTRITTPIARQHENYQE